MRTILASIVIAVIAGYLAYQYELNNVPERIMGVAEERISARGGINFMNHGDRPTAENRAIVRPSPDLIYSSCVFDLSEGPVRFQGVVPDTYWSLSFYAHNSDNFFVRNDRDVTSDTYDYVLVAKGQEAPQGFPESNIVTSPTQTGIALVRIFVEDEATYEAVRGLQQKASCAVFG